MANLTVNNHTINHCFNWIDDSTPLNDINDLFTKRHLGGIIVTAVLMILGFFGNLIVLWIYIRRFKPSTYRIYTIWLALMDIGSCCTGMPFLIYYLSNYVIFPSEALCKIGRFMLVFGSQSSAFILVVIAFDRFRRICCCFKQQVSNNQAIVLCIASCVLGSLTSSPALYLYGNWTIDKDGFQGVQCWTRNGMFETPYPSAYFITMCTVMFLIAGFLFVMYLRILQCLRNQRGTGIDVQTRKTTITLMIVTIGFLASAIPYYSLEIVLRVVKNFNCNMTFNEGVALYTVVFSITINHAINPFIYGFMDARFRRELSSLFSNRKNVELSNDGTLQTDQNLDEQHYQKHEQEEKQNPS